MLSFKTYVHVPTVSNNQKNLNVQNNFFCRHLEIQVPKPYLVPDRVPDL